MKLIDSSAVCDLLGISKSTLYRWCGVSDDNTDTPFKNIGAVKIFWDTPTDPFGKNKDEVPTDFPKPFKLGRAYKWNDQEILAWLETRRVK